MTRQSLLAGSLALNVCLLLVVAFQVFRPQERKKPGEQRAATPHAVNPPSVRQKPTSSGASQAQSAPAFNWRQVESADYKTYIAKMRAIGVPDQTIRDIIIADVTQAYESRRASLLAGRRGPFKFWETADRRRLSLAEMQELETRETELDREMNAVLSALLGNDYEGERAKYVIEADDSAQELNFLPAAKRAELSALLSKYHGLDLQVKSLADWNAPTDDPSELKRIIERYAQEKAELSQLLTPEEYELYELNTSWTADNLRQAMVGFKPTEEEFREIFKKWRAHDEKLAVLKAEGKPDPGNDHVFAAIRETLGETRYQEYRRDWWNRDYHELFQLTQDFGLPEQTAGEVYDLRKTAREQRSQILNDASLTQQQQAAALQALQTEVDSAVAARLGDQAHGQYRAGRGSWIQSLGKAPAAPATAP